MTAAHLKRQARLPGVNDPVAAAYDKLSELSEFINRSIGQRCRWAKVDIAVMAEEALEELLNPKPMSPSMRWAAHEMRRFLTARSMFADFAAIRDGAVTDAKVVQFRRASLQIHEGGLTVESEAL